MRRKTLKPILLPDLPPLADQPILQDLDPPTVDLATDVRLPLSGDDTGLRPTVMWERTAALVGKLDEVAGELRSHAATMAYPLGAYEQFRRDYPLRPPPLPTPLAEPLAIVVDGISAAPFLLRETLRSVQEQSLADWTVTVVAPRAIRDHPVASFADVDPRFRFVDASAFEPPVAGWSLWITAGTALETYALSWLVFAGSRCGAEVAFADHDHGVVDPTAGRLHADPWLYGALDQAMLVAVPAPAVVLASSALVARSALAFDGDDGCQRALLAAVTGRAPHVARVLASRLELPPTAREGVATELDRVAGRLGPAQIARQSPRVEPRDDQIAVVIPSRDAPDLLARAVRTLRGTARLASRLDIVVVDNRTTDPAALALLDEFERTGAARRHPFDLPFNWGLASNEGARASDAPAIVFANNDVEMLSEGWDDILLDALAAPGVGAVGARLLYPNGTVQHGGVFFGMTENLAEHEGRFVSATEPGPNRRLVAPRSAAAVTGAFLAVTRKNFDEIEGIDTNMQIAHSDLDFCLRLRERGLTVRYEPRLELIHFESVTRGVNATKADVAFDESERADLLQRWGDTLAQDVGISPYWARTGTPFEHLREPSMLDVVRHIDRTGRDHPWAPSRREAQEEALWRPEAIG